MNKHIQISASGLFFCYVDQHKLYSDTVLENVGDYREVVAAKG